MNNDDNVWLPFESHPKDGSQFIVWNGEEMAILNKPTGCALGRWKKIGKSWFGCLIRFDNPAHWRKIPKPPSIEGGRKD